MGCTPSNVASQLRGNTRPQPGFFDAVRQVAGDDTARELAEILGDERVAS